ALGLSRPARGAVLRCTGSVCVAASLLFAVTGCAFVRIGSSVSRARGVLPSLVSTARFSDSMSSVLGSDIIVLLTNDEAARVYPDSLAPGTIVIDVAEPPNIAEQAQPDFASRGIRVIDGGIVRIPSLSC